MVLGLRVTGRVEMFGIRLMRFSARKDSFYSITWPTNQLIVGRKCSISSPGLDTAQSHIWSNETLRSYIDAPNYWLFLIQKFQVLIPKELAEEWIIKTFVTSDTQFYLENLLSLPYFICAGLDKDEALRLSQPSFRGNWRIIDPFSPVCMQGLSIVFWGSVPIRTLFGPYLLHM